MLRSYRLKAQLSLSVMEPLKMMDKLTTKSYGNKKETAMTKMTGVMATSRGGKWKVNVKARGSGR